MIHVVGLKKTYDFKAVLHEISFNIKRGEVFGLLGPNGAGKTTTLEILEGVRSFDSGEVLIDGLLPGNALNEGVIGVQLQSSSLPGHWKVKDIVHLFSIWKSKPLKNEDVINFDLDGLHNKRYKTLSTGEKRRLHLYLALFGEPSILFLDEPTAGLDVQTRRNFHKCIKQFKKRGITIILASHDMAEVEMLCDRIGILVNGRIRAIGNPNKIVNTVRKMHTIRLKLSTVQSLPSSSFAEFLGESNGYFEYQTSSVLKALQDLLKSITVQKGKLQDIEIPKQSLEEHYLELSKGE